MRLYERLEGYSTIGIVGMCKNAGKTTVLNAIIEKLNSSEKIGLTSIGYDGEETDQITNLEKPRIPVKEGVLVATASECLGKTQVSYRLVEDTGIRTVIGNIMIVEALGSGIIEVAGPSIVAQMGKILEKFKDYGCTKIFVDGAAGRISFSKLCEANILAVGAAVSTDMHKLEVAVKHQLVFADLEVAVEDSELTNANNRQNTAEQTIHEHNGSLVDEDVQNYALDGKKMISVEHVSSVFLSIKAWNRFKRKGGKLFVRKPFNLLCLTMNPMTPYGPWADKEKMKLILESVTDLPVINVLEEDSYEE